MSHSRFLMRPLALSDAQQYARAASAIAAHQGQDDQIKAESLLVKWQEPDFELDDCSLGCFDSEGQLAAFAVLWANSEAPVHPWLDWGVHPDYHGCGLSAALLEWADDKAQSVLSRCPEGSRVSLLSSALQGYACQETALTRAGYQPNRTWYEMRVIMTERPAQSALPAGFVLRPYRHEEDLRDLVAVVRDSFEDHFGYIEESFDKVYADFQHWLAHDPYFDAELVLLAADESSGEVAGCVLGLTQDHQNADIGYIDIVCVRRAYRRRGLAGALLQRSFAQYWQRGKDTVSLGVDGSSFTNAVALYERVGMRVHRSYVEYEKLVRDGVELAKTSMD